MTRDDIAAMIAGRCGQRTDIDAMIVREIQQAQRTLEKTPPYPWFLLTTYETDYANQTNALPTDFIETLEDIIYIKRATSDTANYTTPVKVMGGHIEHSITGGDETGIPKNFTLVGTNFWFWPTPDQSYHTLMFYYAKDNVLSSGSSTNKWSDRAEDLLIAEAGWQVARNIRDAERAQEFMLDRQEARRRISKETTSRLEAMRRAQIASGEDALLAGTNWGTIS